MTKETVTLRDIYEIVNRLETKMDVRICKTEERINILESFRDELVGKLTIVVAIVSVVITIVIDTIRRRLNL